MPSPQSPSYPTGRTLDELCKHVAEELPLTPKDAAYVKSRELVSLPLCHTVKYVELTLGTLSSSSFQGSVIF